MLRHVRGEPLVRPTVERWLEHDEGRCDTAIETGLAPDACLPSPPERVQQRRRAADDEGQSVHLDEVEDDPGEHGDAGKERPVEAERTERGAIELYRIADVGGHPVRIARRVTRRDAGSALGSFRYRYDVASTVSSQNIVPSTKSHMNAVHPK